MAEPCQPGGCELWKTDIHWGHAHILQLQRQDTLGFEVDLWRARGEFPSDLAGVAPRQKEIRYSSRTRANTEQFKQFQRLSGALATLLEELLADLKDGKEAALLRSVAEHFPASRSKESIIGTAISFRTRRYNGWSIAGNAVTPGFASGPWPERDSFDAR